MRLATKQHLLATKENTNNQCEGRVAQLEERGVCNAEAWGSNPHASTPQPLAAGVVFKTRLENNLFLAAGCGCNAPGNASYRGRTESH